jgi:Glycine rich protein
MPAQTPGTNAKRIRTALIGALAALGVLATAPSALATTTTFNYTGQEQQFFVPDGVTSIHVVAIGSLGGASAFNSVLGGAAGKVTADLAVSPFETLFIEVGGPGANGGSSASSGTGGFNGGGGAASPPGTGGGGGGATDIRTVAGTGASALASRLLVAGGGGGSGDIGGAGGAGGGAVGGDGITVGGAVTGHGGTQTAGGAGGGVSPRNGTLGQGGNDLFGFGGSGGGGYYGGGSGGDHDAGGGGGSGYLGPRTSNGTFTTANALGSVVLTYTAHQPDPPTLTGSSPASPDTSTTPLITGSALAGSMVLLYTNPGCTGGTQIASGPAAQFASPGIQVSVAERSTTTFYARASNSLNISPCSTTSVTYVQNSPPIDQPPGELPGPSAPETAITSSPKAKLTVKKKADVSFEFSSDKAGATFECDLDSDGFDECDSPQDYEVKPGDHTFSVRASAGGVTDPSPATFKFTVKKKPKHHHHN